MYLKTPYSGGGRYLCLQNKGEPRDPKIEPEVKGSVTSVYLFTRFKLFYDIFCYLDMRLAILTLNS